MPFNKNDDAFALMWAKKIKAINMLGGKCSICGYSKNYASLDFHHSGEKEISIGKLFGRAKMEAIHSEVKKCILVCRNCHMEIHHPEYTKIGMGVVAIK